MYNVKVFVNVTPKHETSMDFDLQLNSDSHKVFKAFHTICILCMCLSTPKQCTYTN